jgi:hypothetical protein
MYVPFHFPKKILHAYIKVLNFCQIYKEAKENEDEGGREA